MLPKQAADILAQRGGFPEHERIDAWKHCFSHIPIVKKLSPVF